MTIRSLRLFPDPILSQPCKTVRSFDHHLNALVRDLIDTLYHSPGVGLAAPQIGQVDRVSVIDIHRSVSKRTPPVSIEGIIILVNPVLISAKGAQVPREGCLSVPDWLANVRRYQEVIVRTHDLKGGERTISAQGFEALALQHEIDHLDGKLFLDRVVDLKTDLYRRKTYR